MSHTSTQKISFAGLLITLGIVFGDIGTSPLYVFQAITGQGKHVSPDFILGALSSVIWTLILIATVKYIYFALNADNKGEGGIFALFALLKEKNAKWIIIPALIGCATLMADGFITPAISISSAVEGVNNIFPDMPVIPIVVVIIVMLFVIQQFGTAVIGKMFGPVMFVWFIFLGYLGFTNIAQNWGVLQAFNPYWAYNLVANVDGGFTVLGSVFLCTTGAEALYSDLGHCGKGNIRLSWTFVSSLLVLNYLGQAALCLKPGFHLTGSKTVFYSMVPDYLMPFAVAIATLATIIASQALITGVFTLMNEAIKLKLWTNLRVKYPSDHQGQIYIPFINWFLMIGCLAVIAIFRKSSAMEHTYGLAITIDMVMTSILLCFLLMMKYPKIKYVYVLIFGIFLLIEGVFLLSNLGKVVSGGWFTLILACTFFALLYLYYKAKQLRSNITEYVPMRSVIPLMEAVHEDKGIMFEATNLVFPTRSNSPNKLDLTVFHSLFNKKPRKAGIFWFLHLDILNEPWGVHYSVNEIIDKRCYYVSLQLGFKEEHRIEYMMRKIHCKMIEKGELTGDSVFESLRGKVEQVDFKFIVLNSRVSTDNNLTAFQRICIKAYRFVKSTGLKPAEDFGLDKTNVVVDYIPISVTAQVDQDMTEDFENYSQKIYKVSSK
ncbi:MAG: KUP/HAK/KT family potassium transporter [Crocinitomicaceae bacterium]|jgi:KUP system potassium uptake protein|nr:KUP/HAK/KT family potassium transporter [Crocinitomicaceae bacterium]MDP4761917.1 KUP/HAK/KT family potassium transporter [Crocinitomicaceae bacterium]